MAQHSAEYKRYLKSPEWAERKRRYYQHHPRRCAACGIYKKIHLHHSSYEMLTREPDSDLWPLCFRCHRNVHRAYASGRFRDLRGATGYVVSKGKARQWRRKQLRRFARWVRRQLAAAPGVKSA
jgi:hypothetical protein